MADESVEKKADAAVGMSSGALLLSLASIGIVVYFWFFRDDPLGKGIDKYDFSTPTAALKAEWQMDNNADFKAALELARKTRKKTAEEKLVSVEVKKEAEWRGKKILFYSYREEGVTKYSPQGFEKHADTGYWMKTYVSTSSVREDNKSLADMIESWEKSGSFEPKPTDKK
jgi:hypothetical protein